MKGLMIITLAITWGAFAASTALADELVPATSEDLAQFDRQLSRLPKPADRGGSKAAGTRSDFGKRVSTEARRLDGENSAPQNRFGQWVKGQKERDERSRDGGRHGVRDDGGDASSARSGRDRDRKGRRGRN